MHPAPFFGLSDPGLFVKCIKLEDRVAALREMAPLFRPPFGLEKALVLLVREDDLIGRVLEFATLFPQAIPGTTTKTHRRWLVLPDTNYAGDSSSFHQQWEPIIIRRSLEIMKMLGEPCGFLSADTFARIDSGLIHPTITDKPDFTWNIMTAQRSIKQSIELLVNRSSLADEFLPPHKRRIGWERGHLEHEYEDASYKFAFGDGPSAAVYQPYHSFRSHSYDLPLAFVTEALGTGRLEPSKLFSHFEDCTIPVLAAVNTPEYFRSLIALSTAREIYDDLSQADVDVSVVSRPIARARWASTSLSQHMSRITRNISLACVSMFDTGYLDLQTEDLDDVLAISSGNALYASEILLCDPTCPPKEHALRHLIGNVGKPGLALLLSPRDTILREPDFETWQLVNHDKFEGVFEDSFASTSLHLSLTGYEQPLNIQRHGGRDKEAFYLEAVISAHKNGAWVADLNFLDLFRNIYQAKGDLPLRSPLRFLPPTCTHDAAEESDTTAFPILSSIDNWYEYLDRPSNAAIIRARGNWIARSAFAAIRLPEQEKLIIGSERICWACVKELMIPQGLPTGRQLFLC